MKRISVLLLALLLLFVACDNGNDVVLGNAFSQDEDGYGVTDTVTGIHYRALDFAFEPAVTSGVVGTYVDGAYTRTFYVIEGLDSAFYIADNELSVWYAGETDPDPRTLTTTAVLVCEQTSYSRELLRFSAGADDDVITRIKQLWFEGQAAEYPETAIIQKRTMKLKFQELTNIFYCFDLGVWEEGTFFYDKITKRAVAVPGDLADQLLK